MIEFIVGVMVGAVGYIYREQIKALFLKVMTRFKKPAVESEPVQATPTPIITKEAAVAAPEAIKQDERGFSPFLNPKD